MQNAVRVSALMCGVAIVLVPAVGEATIGYRASGGACHAWTDEYDDNYAYLGSRGLYVYGNGSQAWAACAIPTSDYTFAPGDLTSVEIRYAIAGNAYNVHATLEFHDYNSNDYVECDHDVDTDVTGTYGLLRVENTCSNIETTWGVMVEVWATDMATNEYMTVKTVTARSL